jgi:hypothetical protein
MKQSLINAIKAVGLGLILLICSEAAYGQQGRLQIDSLDKFASKAVESIDVTLDESLLQLASKFLNEKRSPDEAKIKEIVAGLKGVYVKRFGFENEGEFNDGDVESIRAQLKMPGWSRIVGVRTRKQTNLNVDVYLMYEGSIIKGLAVLATEPKALTVVNIVGPIDLEKLSELGGKFGIPTLDLIQGKVPGGEDSVKEKPVEKKTP